MLALGLVGMENILKPHISLARPITHLAICRSLCPVDRLQYNAVNKNRVAANQICQVPLYGVKGQYMKLSQVLRHWEYARKVACS